MSRTLARLLSETATHKNNPTGASLATVASGIACAPIDSIAQVYAQAYPFDKLFLMKQTFTEYAAFVAGDYLVADGVTYAVKAVHKWDSPGRYAGTGYILILEQQSGS